MYARLSILGLYNYDDTIFDNLEAPQGIDKNLLIDTILHYNAELSLVFSNARYMKRRIGEWSKQRQWGWNKYANIYQAQYNPTHNYNMLETETINTTTNETSSGENLSSEMAFNANSMAENAKMNISEDRKNVNELSRTFTREGNIGVMTTQMMLKEEMGIASSFDIYKKISDEFAEEFTIGIY